MMANENEINNPFSLLSEKPILIQPTGDSNPDYIRTDKPVAFVSIGDKLGSYLIQELIGKGNFGSVFRALDTNTDRQVAIKVRQSSNAERIPNGFNHEAKAVGRLEHPNIVRMMHAVKTNDGIDYIVYEYVRGKTLDNHIKPTLCKIDDAVEWIASIAEALAYAHLCGIVHRDLSLRNIMIDQTGQARLLDFGLSSVDNGFPVPLDQQIIGTPPYLSPEQSSGKPEWATAYSDLFSLGSVLYHALTGQPPFHGSCLRDLRERIQSASPASPRSLRVGISLELEEVCLKALSKDPKQRYSTGGDFAKALRASIVPFTPPVQQSPAQQQSMWPILAGIGMLLIGILTMAVVWMQYSQSRPPEVPPGKLMPGEPLQPSPKLTSVEIKINGNQEFNSDILPINGEVKFISVSPVFTTNPKHRYLMVFNQSNGKWNRSEFIDDTEKIKADWLGDGANMILVCGTGTPLYDSSFASANDPFCNDYKEIDSTVFHISHNCKLDKRVKEAKYNWIKQSGIALIAFENLEIARDFKNQLVNDFKIESYYGVVFGIEKMKPIP